MVVAASAAFQVSVQRLFHRFIWSHILLITRLLTALLLLTFCLDAVAKSAADFYESAVERFRQEDYRAAVILLKNALEDDPDHLPSRILRGNSLLHAGDAAAAEKDLQTALASGADEEQVVVLLGSAYLIQGKYEQLLNEVKSGGRATDIETEILVLRAHAYLYLGQMELAEESFTRARRISPREAGPILGLATVEIQRGNLDAAEKFVEEAEQFGPDEAETWYGKGEIQRLRGQNDLALTSLNNAIERDPQHMPARLSRAAILINQGEDAAAREDVDLILKNSPDNYSGRYLNAMLLARAGKYKEAITEINGISQILSTFNTSFINNHSPTLLLLGTLEYLQNHLDKAEVYLKRYLKIHPQHLQPRMVLAEVQMKKGDSDGVIITLKPMLADHPDNAELLILLGTAFLNAQRYDEATEMLDKAAVLKPNLASIRTRLALSRLGAGQPDAAMQELESALEMDTSQSRPGIMLAIMQLQKGSFDQVLATTTALQAEHPNNPMLYNLTGAAHLRKRDINAARKAFEKALQVQPEFLPPQLNLANLDISEKKYDAARARYEQILRRLPGEVRAMSGLATIAQFQGEHLQAISWLEKIRNTETQASISPDLMRLANLYLQTGQPESALEVATQLGQLEPGTPAVMEIMGKAHLAMGNQTDAARFFRIVFQGNPDSLATLQRIGVLLIQAGDLKTAGKALDTALEKDPGYLPARGSKILLENMLGHSDQAIALALQLQKDHPGLSLGYRLMGDLYMQTGNFDGAAKAYAAGFERQPSSGLLLTLFRAEQAVGKSESGIGLLKEWLEKHPGDYQIRRFLAVLHHRDERQDEALKQYEILAEQRPDDFEVHNNLAGLYQLSNDPRALASAQKAYELAPKQPAANDTLGWILVKQGKFNEGLAYLRQAHALEFQQPEVRYHLAVALYGLGRNEEAKQELEAALATDKPFKEAEEARKLLAQIGSSQ